MPRPVGDEWYGENNDAISAPESSPDTDVDGTPLPVSPLPLFLRREWRGQAWWKSGAAPLTRQAALGALVGIPLLYAAKVGPYLKIGWTESIVHRVNVLGNEVGAPPIVLAITHGTRDDETVIHRSLRPHVAKGREWYHPTSEVMAVVNAWRAQLGRDPVEFESAPTTWEGANNKYTRAS